MTAPNKTQLFETWVKKNYVGVEMESCPSDWDRCEEFFYKIDGLQYRIKFTDVPEEFTR